MKISKPLLLILASGSLCASVSWLIFRYDPPGLGPAGIAISAQVHRPPEQTLAEPLSNDPRALEGQSLNDAELQRMLNIPDGAWNGRLKQISRLLEDNQDGAAATLLAQWLESDFEGALLALPLMVELRFRYEERFPTGVFVQHLNQLAGDERMEVLGLLGYGNLAVRLVAFRTMKDWWTKSPDTMLTWIERTPSFTDYGLLQEFLGSIDIAGDASSKIAYTFFSLDAGDPRRSRFFDQVMTRWMESDITESRDFIESTLALEAGSAGERPGDYAVPDQTIARFAFAFADDNNLPAALEWIARIKSADSRELYLRDLSHKALSETDRRAFRDWIAKNSIATEELRLQIEESLTRSGG